MQYLVNDRGINTAVIVPIKEYNDLKQSKRKLQILLGIDNALQEVADVKAGKRKEGRTLEEFLDEN
jgi:hypothetical protein